MVPAVSLIFGVLGLVLLSNGIQNFRARSLALDEVPPEMRDQMRQVFRNGIIASNLAGVSFALASALVWWNWPSALLLGGWPIVLFGAMLIAGKVDVVTRFSSGSSESDS